MYKKYILILKKYLIGWFFALIVWIVLRGEYIQNSEILSSYKLLLYMASWLFQAVLYGTLHFLIDKYLNRKIRFIYLLLTSLVLQVIVAFGVLYLLYPILVWINIEGFGLSFRRFLQLPDIPIILFYALTINFIISLTIKINMILGKGMLVNLIKGKFYRPRVEQRIFMFLDLRGSTTIAERIGHIRFSRLIQDCFDDLAVIDKYKAEVYKYIGDEVVLLWNVEEGKKSLNCIKAFYEFEDEINNKAGYYQKEYGVVPEFKAGIHAGEITVAEVGELKQVIAYLGDTVNTTARIQGQCNDLKSDFLISESLLKELKLNSDFKTEKKGNILLRGKKEGMSIFSIEKKASH